MYLLGDVGGTKTRLVWCKSEKDLREQKLKIFATSQKYREFLRLLRDFIDFNKRQVDEKRFKTRIISKKGKGDFQFLEKMKKAVFGFAGMLDKKKEKLIYAPNLKDFENKSLKKDLEKILNCEVILENDAVLAGLGEGKYGVGKNFDAFGYITLSTGVGGSKIIKINVFYPNENQINYLNKKMDNSDKISVLHSSSNIRISNWENIGIAPNIFGFEPGHSFLLVNDFLFEVEEFLGGESIRKIFAKKPEEIEDKKFWNYYYQILSIFLINVSIFWSVEKIILGGSLVRKIDLRRINFYLDKFHSLPFKIQVRKSALGDLAGIYGSLVKLRDR